MVDKSAHTATLEAGAGGIPQHRDWTRAAKLYEEGWHHDREGRWRKLMPGPGGRLLAVYLEQFNMGTLVVETLRDDYADW